MFTQLLHYVQDALNKGETVPPFLAVADKFLSPKALTVHDAGRSLRQAYFAETDVHTVREALKLNRAVGAGIKSATR